MVRVLIYIDDKGDDAFPAVKTIARDLGLNERNVRSAITQARQLGYLSARPRTVPGSGFRGYFFNVEYPPKPEGPGAYNSPGRPPSRVRTIQPGGRKTPGRVLDCRPGAYNSPDELESVNEKEEAPPAPPKARRAARRTSPDTKLQKSPPIAARASAVLGTAPAHGGPGEGLEARQGRPARTGADLLHRLVDDVNRALKERTRAVLH